MEAEERCWWTSVVRHSVPGRTGWDVASGGSQDALGEMRESQQATRDVSWRSHGCPNSTVWPPSSAWRFHSSAVSAVLTQTGDPSSSFHSTTSSCRAPVWSGCKTTSPSRQQGQCFTQIWAHFPLGHLATLHRELSGAGGAAGTANSKISANMAGHGADTGRIPWHLSF